MHAGGMAAAGSWPRASARRLLLAGAYYSLLWLLDLPWATAAVRRSDFPASFLFGTATSSYQVCRLYRFICLHLCCRAATASAHPHADASCRRLLIGRWRPPILKGRKILAVGFHLWSISSVIQMMRNKWIT